MGERGLRVGGGSDGERACCKAGRIAAKYGFEDALDGTLGEEWAAMDGPGLRTIAERFNERVVQETLLERGEPPIEGEEDLIYDRLTDDGTADRVERRLERNGIDPTRLREDFVSYKTIDRHFKNCTDRERETTDPLDAADAIDRVRAMNRRAEKVAANTLSELTETSLGGDDPDVSASVTVTCPECNERLSFTAAVRDGCACHRDGTEPAPDEGAEETGDSIRIEDS